MTYQLQTTKAKVLVCHKENLETALIACQESGITMQNIFVFGDEVVHGIQPFNKALILQRKVTLEELTYEQYKTKIAYLCFSSGTTGVSKGVMTT